MTETPNTQREALKKRLRALLNMTEKNGCTEAEALAAAQKAADLMSEHDLSYETADDVKAERFGARRRDMNANLERRSTHEVQFVCTEIAALFDCEVWQQGGMRVFFGTEHDTQAAHDMADMLCHTMEREFIRYMQSPRPDSDVHGRSVRVAFMSGMYRRLCERIREIRTARTAAARAYQQSTGRALMLVTKTQEVAQRFATYKRERNMNLGGGRSHRKTIRSGHAREAGVQAGNRAGLGPSVSGGSGVRMIGGR